MTVPTLEDGERDVFRGIAIERMELEVSVVGFQTRGGALDFLDIDGRELAEITETDRSDFGADPEIKDVAISSIRLFSANLMAESFPRTDPIYPK